MIFKKIIKSIFSRLSKFGRAFYRVLYAYPYRVYMKKFASTMCAVNILNINKSKSYKPLEYFPTLIYSSQKGFKGAYKKAVKFDSNQIPMLYICGDYQYLPITIAQHGLCLYNFFLDSGDVEFLSKAEGVGRWLIDNQNKENGAWEYKYDFYLTHTSETIKSPFCSSMGQGEAIALLCRLFKETGNREYLNAAIRAIEPFDRLAEDGGVLTYFYDKPFYEEFPAKTPVLILNGFVFSLIGLYDLYITCDCKKAYELFLNGLETLVEILPFYDYGFTSLYCLNHFTASPRKASINEYYHPIHIQLLQAINTIYPSKVLEFYINKWI